MNILKTYLITLNGRVQGVGFRPFIFRLANDLTLFGTVSNNSDGVLIYVTTDEKQCCEFIAKIKEKKPPIAIIKTISIQEISIKKFTDFQIISSSNKSIIDLLLTPDFAICDSCKSEIVQPKNRRYGYAFTSCVSCGPRYAITKKYPFERHYTSLSDFKLCTRCQEEYLNPTDRRFYSQITTCQDCGIQLQLTDNQGKKIKTTSSEIITQVAKLVQKGSILAIKNINGYLLCCDATNLEAINRLRIHKKRPSKPFAVLYPNIETIVQEFEVSPAEQQAITSSIAPIVILKNTKKTSTAVSIIAPNLQQTGVMLPYSALLQLLMNNLQNPIVATSGNYQGSSIVADEEQANKQLVNIADYLLHHNLKINFPQDDSLIQFSHNNKQIILRRSRGLAPSNLAVKITTEKTILAMGANLKSTFSYSPNNQLYTSQYFGDLQHYEVFKRYKKTLNQYFELFDKQPEIILIDSHPQYQSSIYGKRLALEKQLPIYQIQHHKAHFSSILGEHHLFDSKEKILGVVWDGSGLGEDGNIWGGEFFTFQNKEIKRLTHFKYFNWIAHDKFAKEPRLVLLSLLDKENLPLYKKLFTDTEWSIYRNLLSKNTLKTSSVGRLFDAVSCVLDLCYTNSYEAQASLLLENCANNYLEKDNIDFLMDTELLSPYILIKKIIEAKILGISQERLASSFIYTLASSIIKIANLENIKTIACSGGVFQNALLVSMLSKKVKESNIELKINCNLPPNDENISFGQMMYYLYCKNKKICV